MNDLDALHSFDVTCFRKTPSIPHSSDDDGECVLNALMILFLAGVQLSLHCN